jgi:hypothetical protein
LKNYYPLFNWTPELEEEMTLTGVLLDASANDEYGSASTAFPDFGYADTGMRGTSNSTNLNPYIGLDNRSWRTTVDGFDLKWAVDEDGEPVDLPDGIYYIKIQTASFINAGSIGEKSTEINGILLAEPAAEPVGVTAAPSSITVGGVVYSDPEDGEVIDNVEVPGVFTVSVAASDGANVYVNGARGASRTFTKIPDHGMLRIIVQEGDSAPFISYMNLTEGGQGGAYTLVTFDAAGGTVSYGGESAGVLEVAYTPESVRAFPVPVKPEHEFLGWYDAGGAEYTAYSDDMPGTLALAARWQYTGSGVSEPAVNTPAEGEKPRALDPVNEYVVLGVQEPSDPNTVLALAEMIGEDNFGGLPEAAREKLAEIIGFDGDGSPLIDTDKVMEGLRKARGKGVSVPAVDESSLRANQALVFETNITQAYGVEDGPDVRKLAMLTFEVNLSHFAGRRIGDVYMLNYIEDDDGDDVTVPFAPATAAYDMRDGEFIFTDDDSEAINPDHLIKANMAYYVTLAILDDGPYDADPAKGGILDPSTPALKSSASGPPAGSPGSGEFSGGGCDAGLGIAPFALLAIGLALYRKKRNLP